MKFRLIYDGPLQPSQRDPENGQADPVGLHKHTIRRAFHGQLKRLWETNLFLKDHTSWPADYDLPSIPGGGQVPLKELIAQLYEENGFRFVPLVREQWSLKCSLDILFLRRDEPGSIIKAGDLDNRIKTLIDALRKPKGRNELGGQTPAADEDPFYCLLEDDQQVTALTVESGQLLDPLTLEEADNRRVRLVIKVDIQPFYGTMFNLSFV